MMAGPGVLSALEHGRLAAQSTAPHFETLDDVAAREIEALAAQIIPSTGGPGAREAGVIYFIDRALATFASDDREKYRTGLAQFQQKRQELFPTSTSIASLTDAQQKALLRATEKSDFFDLLRTHTVLASWAIPATVAIAARRAGSK